MEDRIPTTPPLISPIEHMGKRPLFSVMIPTYNCIRYLPDTLESVLVQYGGADNMQVEVVDDCSEDGDVQQLVNRIGKGVINFYRQPENKGSLRNFETCINRAKGHYIHLLHGDDLVKPGFYEEVASLFSNFHGIGAAITNHSRIDEDNVESEPRPLLIPSAGIIYDWLTRIASKQLVQPPAVVVKREVYEKLGGYYGVQYGEDWEMWIRIAAHYPVAYSPKCLATYRAGHQTNISSRSILSGKNIADIKTVIKLSQQYLPREKRRKIKKLAQRNFSKSYANYAFHYYKKNREGHEKIALRMAQSALVLNVNIRSVYWSACLLYEWLTRQLHFRRPVK